jgi:hypothetical protein
MSAKDLAVCSFEPSAEQKVGTGHQALEGHAAECQFREALWQEYRIEAINAGFNSAQATEYASALSPEIGQVAGVSEVMPAERGWSYQSRVRVVHRTINSGLIKLVRWDKSKTIRRTAAAGVPIFSFGFRPWNVGGKS